MTTAAAGAGAAASEAGKGAAATGTDAAAAAAAAAGGGDGKAAGAGDGKKADETGGAGEGGKKVDEAAAAAAAANKPPDKYVLKLSDGSRLTAADVQYVEQLAKTNGWSQEDATLALKEYEDRSSKQADGWLAETKADKTYGGDNLSNTQTLAKRAIDAIRPAGHARREAFTNLLKHGGIEHNIEVLSFLADLGKQMSEDRPAQGAAGGGTGGQTRDAADVLYGGTTK